MRKGFTLLELLIVVIIVGILATLAIPNFIRAAERAKWAEAKSVLGAMRGAQVRYMAQHDVYVDDASYPYDDIDVDITVPRYFDFKLEPVATELAMATRKSDGGPLPGQTLAINIDGNLTYSGGVPEWVK